MTASDFEYGGEELELFALAVRWKAYIRENFAPFLGPRVLEVGAGFGAVTRALLHEKVNRWTCLEPDVQLASRIACTVGDHPVRKRIEVVHGSTSDLIVGNRYDTVLYVDVLEHIEDDAAELRRAFDLLAEGGRLIVLSPAYNWLCSPFDSALGHYRRYTAKSLAAVAPISARCERLFYLDSVGLLVSLANKLLLRQSLPTRSQILLWDGTLIPLSRILDPLIAFRAGRSIVGIWRKTATG